MELYERGLIGVPGTPELIGANAEAIATAEDREQFKQAMLEIGLDVPRVGHRPHARRGARRRRARSGCPVIIRPAYILGGTRHRHRHHARASSSAWPPTASPPARSARSSSSESIAGWKEYELEVMRDRADNCVIICSIENVDPMGVHTGDSITVAPAQTLTDVEYQQMRDAAFACIRRVGVETGGSNVQFAVDPTTGDMVVIEMNPRVSRSSALASKATGFPIAKIAARLAVGYTLDEIPNDITERDAGVSFEPTIDYVVTKMPRWAFEKLPGTHRRARHADAVGRRGDGDRAHVPREPAEGAALARARAASGSTATRPRPQLDDARRRRAACARAAIATPDRIVPAQASCCAAASASSARPRGDQDRPVVPRPDLADRRGARPRSPSVGLDGMTPRPWRRAKRLGFSDAQLAYLWGVDEADGPRGPRWPPACAPTYKTVDTCAAEFAADDAVPLLDLRGRGRGRARRPARRSSSSARGPNRIGQGIEFDYCCVHASFALRDAGFETVMVNCNPETVSTDYDTRDRLYFEPLTARGRRST